MTETTSRETIITENTINMIKEEIPDFSVEFKNEDTLQKFICVLLFFNPGYMTSFTTTLYPKVYFPTKESEKKPNFYKTLCHEFVHLVDRRDHGVWFSISYLFPQILALFSLLSVLSFISLHFLWSLLFLIFLAPLPSYFRTKWELRGYTTNLFIEYLVTGQFNEEQIKLIKNQFLTMNYYKMCWSEEKINKEIDLIKKKIEEGTITEGKEGYVYKKIEALHK